MPPWTVRRTEAVGSALIAVCSVASFTDVSSPAGRVAADCVRASNRSRECSRGEPGARDLRGTRVSASRVRPMPKPTRRPMPKPTRPSAVTSSSDLVCGPPKLMTSRPLAGNVLAPSGHHKAPQPNLSSLEGSTGLVECLPSCCCAARASVHSRGVSRRTASFSRLCARVK
jgi:hypothetical protein